MSIQLLQLCTYVYICRDVNPTPADSALEHFEKGVKEHGFIINHLSHRSQDSVCFVQIQIRNHVYHLVIDKVAIMFIFGFAMEKNIFLYIYIYIYVSMYICINYSQQQTSRSVQWVRLTCRKCWRYWSRLKHITDRIASVRTLLRGMWVSVQCFLFLFHHLDSTLLISCNCSTLYKE